MEMDWEDMCRGQQEEISKLKLHITQLESLLHDSRCHEDSASLSDSDAESTPSCDENRTSNPCRDPNFRDASCIQRTHTQASPMNWKNRIKSELEVLERAEKLVARQKRDLRHQIHQLKAEKESWRHEQMTGQSSIILKEMKRILDHNTHTLNQNIRSLRSAESRLQNRMSKSHQMELMVDALENSSSNSSIDNSPSSPQDIFSLFDSDDGQSLASSNDTSSLLDGLNRLHDELQTDAYRLPQQLYVYGDEPSAFFHITMHTPPPMSHETSAHHHRDFRPRESQILRDVQCASIYEKQIAKWVYGRRRVQQAAKQHAKWLTSLCDELDAYSKTYAESASVDPTAVFMDDQELGKVSNTHVVIDDMAEHDENAYEKLSREVHQAQITGAIHQDWLENPCGFLLKPDFKRKMQKLGAGGKKLIQTSLRGLRLHLPGSTYRSRWFVLDGMMLRYFRSKNDDQELGSIHLTSVNAVLPSSIADAPENALDLVCADRIYTIAATTREDMVRWATVLTLVLRGEYQPKLMQRRESAVIRGSSVIPPHTRMSYIRQPSQVQNPTSFQPVLATFDEEMEDREQEMDENFRAMSVREKIITVTFDSPGSLHLLLQSTMDDAIMVKGFREPPEGGVGLAEATGAIKVGDILVCIQDHSFSTLPFNTAVEEIQNASRPLTLRFSRLEAPPLKHQQRVAQGWVLAKEPATTRCRVRLLQLQGSKVCFFKPGMHNGHQEHPSVTISLDDVTDIRAVHDKRKTPGDPKEFGITLEGKEILLTFYVNRPTDVWHWLDLLKNAPLFEKAKKSPHSQSTIPIHPLMVIEQPSKRSTIVLEGVDIMKLSDLCPTFEPRTVVLHSYGKLAFFKGDIRVGTIRCESIQDISLSKCRAFWYLELIVLLVSNGKKYRREVVLRFDSEQQGMKWTRAIERVAQQCSPSGDEIDVTIEAVDDWSPLGKDLSNDVTDDEYLDHQREWSLSRHLGDLKLDEKETLTQGWFFVKKPGELGREAYHARYVVLRNQWLYMYKYHALDDPTGTMCSTKIDLCEIQDIIDGNPSSVETMENTIQLKTASNVIFTIVALSYAQKEAWLSLLVWTSDYYYQESAWSLEPQLHHSTTTGEHMLRPSFESNPQSSQRGGDIWDSDSISQVRGWIQLDGHRVYACILQGVFSYYETEDDLDSEWGDAIDAIPLTSVQRVYSVAPKAFVVHLSNDAEVTLQCDDVKWWMLAICSCSHLVLSATEQGFESQMPNEAWIWKLDPLFQVHRKRYFCLKNHELVVMTEPNGRVLLVVSLEHIVGLFMSKVTGREVDDYFQLRLQCTTSNNSSNDADDAEEDEETLFTLSLSFFDESEMKQWATDIFQCCTNASTNPNATNLTPPTSVAIFPQDLMKTSMFQEVEPSYTLETGNARGWLYYRTSPTQRLRRRYFVQYGSELSIYKHELLPEEPSAIRYGVIDCRALLDVHFISTNCPENAMELEFVNATVLIVPESDAAALAWRQVLIDVKRTYSGSNGRFDNAVLISRSSTFASQKESETLLRSQIESSVQFVANMQEWDGSKWVANYFVLTGSRLLVFSLAVHLYDEDPDLLSTFVMKQITYVRNLTPDEEDGGASKSSFAVGFAHSKLILKCDTVDLCLQMMRLLCHSNGKLELKQNATTGAWGSVNRIASMSRHNSFLLSTPPAFDTTSKESAGRVSRRASMQRRTSELIQRQRTSIYQA
ncbi:hypothetical protein LEN26_020082 [Aphanomyces euteiches]|nr:hypothetical protein LEN26_020082 [Aphanomyces euteiches]